MFASILYTNFARNISHSKESCGRYYQKKCTSLHVKYPLLLSDMNSTLISPIDFLKNPHISNSMAILSVGAELLRAYGRTDITKLKKKLLFSRPSKLRVGHIFKIC